MPVDQSILQSWVRAYADGTDRRGQSSVLDTAPESTRPASDARAAWQKWHHGDCVFWFSESQMPWYTALERARVECLAARELPGVARNLKALPGDGLGLASAARPLYSSARTLWGLSFDSLQGGSLEGSASGASEGRGLINTLSRLMGRESNSGLGSARVREVLDAAGQYLDNEISFARVVRPLVVQLEGSEKGLDTADPAVFEQGDVEGNATEGEDEAGYGPDQGPERHSRIGNYAIFRTAWDECEAARVWHKPADAEALRALNALDRRRVQKLAHELQRRLLVQRLRHWDFELEEGMLDSRRLAALVGERPDHRVFKFEREARIPEACVTLLVDQSGSMRGSSHLLAAQAIDIAVHTLEVCGVVVEVLGYTTSYGVDNPVVESWQKAGRPAQPGRLNALRHIILKAAQQPWRVAHRHLGLLLRPDFGHENIDGESLYWAARRLLTRPEQRKILVVISDGSPYDEATVQSNDAGILTDHLRAVIHAIEQTPIHLVGIGTGREVGRYYRNAATVRRGDMIGSILFSVLGDSLDQSAVP